MKFLLEATFRDITVVTSHLWYLLFVQISENFLRDWCTEEGHSKKINSCVKPKKVDLQKKKFEIHTFNLISSKVACMVKLFCIDAWGCFKNMSLYFDLS